MTFAASLAAQITGTYNTGWMAGDIRRCMFSDTALGVVDGVTERVVNGSFPVDLSGWTVTGTAPASVTWSAGGAVLATGASTNDAILTQQLSGLTPGRTYRLVFTWTGTSVASGNANLQIRVGATSGSSEYLQSTSFNVAQGAAWAGNYTFTAPTGGSAWLYFNNFTDNVVTQATLTGVSVLECVADRSYKAKSAKVFGTGLVRSQAASGAQMTLLSGFSGTSYVQEAYSADLDFASGFALLPWISLPAGAVASTAPAPGGVGSGTAVSYLPLANFPPASIPLTMNTADWTKGTGWSASAGGTVTCDGSQTGNTDLSWTAGANQTLPNNATVRRWTITVSAISGTLIVYPFHAAPFSITAPGTYTGIGGNWSGGGSQIFRMQAGQTCSLTITLDDLGTACVADRSAVAGAYWKFGVNAVGYLIGEVFDGTTVRQVVSASAVYMGVGTILPELSLSTSGALTLKVGGRQVGQATGNTLNTLANASAVLTLGNNFLLNAPFPGSIALVRISATVPTDEQSRFIWSQERAMFRDSAQVTLPDSGSCVDLDYDPDVDRWRVASATNESEFSGLVRTATTPVQSGNISRVAGQRGMKMVARNTYIPGVDITMPALNLREELVRRVVEAAARRATGLEQYDWVGGFTATTNNNNTGYTGVTALSLPAGATVSGAQVVAGGPGPAFPAGTLVAFIIGTVGYFDRTVTTSGGGQVNAINFVDFILPEGMEARDVFVSGTMKQEGSTKDYTRLYDGFRERVRFGTAPGNTTWVRINARKIQN
jgi:hypothetical protein